MKKVGLIYYDAIRDGGTALVRARYKPRKGYKLTSWQGVTDDALDRILAHDDQCADFVWSLLATLKTALERMIAQDKKEHRAWKKEKKTT